MNSKYKQKRRAKTHKIFGDLYSEEDQQMRDMYAQFFMLSLLSPNGGGLKNIFGVKKEDLLRV